MRRVGVIAMLMCLGACATVTVQPASMTVSMAQTDSPLSEASKNFSETAQERGWIEKSSPMSFLQAHLFGGGTQDKEDPTDDYLANINSAPLDKAREDLVTDVTMASGLLADLNALAESAANGTDQPVRADIINFEDALISARKSFKVFEAAAEVIESRSPVVAYEVNQDLHVCNAEIEHSRALADELVAAWRASKKDAIS